MDASTNLLKLLVQQARTVDRDVLDFVHDVPSLQGGVQVDVAALRSAARRLDHGLLQVRTVLRGRESEADGMAAFARHAQVRPCTHGTADAASWLHVRVHRRCWRP